MSQVIDAAEPAAAAHRVRDGAVLGALAGVAGGVVFGASMIELGSLESIAALVRADTSVSGALVHLAVSALVGAVFGLLVFHQRTSAADTLLWGMTYGAFFWFVGPLTLRPLIVREQVTWDIGAAGQYFGSLVGHVVWGAVTGLALAALQAIVAARRAAPRTGSHDPSTRRRSGRARMAAIGGAAGLAAAAILTAWLPAADELTAPVGTGGPTNWLATLAVGAVAGACYGALVPHSSSPSTPQLGARLVQGLALGYLAWIVVALTIVPLVQSNELAWTASSARSRFELLSGYLLFGALSALLFSCLAGGARFLFSDEVRRYNRFTAGPQRVQAILRGAGAGIVGGLIFTIVFVQIGGLDRVSELVGAESAVVGFLVHMVIATIIGVSYALLFRRHSFDVRSGIGWGVAYGLLWWILGALTLLPVFLGGDPQWSADAAASAFPSLVGHIAYGMGLGVAFYLLEARYNPWWISHSEAETHITLERRQQVLTSAPALWSFAVFVTVFVTIVLVSGAPPT